MAKKPKATDESYDDVTFHDNAETTRIVYVPELPKDYDGPTTFTKGVERPDMTAPQDEADARRKAWEKAHAQPTQ